MKIYFNISNGYLNGWSSNAEGYEYSLEVPDDHEVLQVPHIFKYEDGQLIKDEDFQQQLKQEEEERQNKLSDDELNAIALMELTEMIMGGGD